MLHQRSSTSENSRSSPLSIAAELSGIKSLGFETIHSIWMKAESYLEADKDIVPAPGVNKSMMVASRSFDVPHFVRAETGSKYSCDNNCLQLKSSGVCSYIISVAEKNHELKEFLQWYNSHLGPNITTLALSDFLLGEDKKLEFQRE